MSENQTSPKDFNGQPLSTETLAPMPPKNSGHAQTSATALPEAYGVPQGQTGPQMPYPMAHTPAPTQYPGPQFSQPLLS